MIASNFSKGIALTESAGSARDRRMPGHRRSVPLYVGAGGIATACHYACTIAAVEWIGVPPLAGSVVGFTVGALVKYFLNYRYAFESDARHSAAMLRFLVYLAAMFLLNAALFASFQQGLGWHYMVAQVVTTILLIPPGYALSRLWVFRR